MFEQFRTIMDPMTAWKLQYELLEDEDDMRVTRSAVALMDLLESQTGTFNTSFNRGPHLLFY